MDTDVTQNACIIDRIASYVSQCVKYFDDPTISRNATHYFKIRKIFTRFGCSDIAAITTLSKLCRKSAVSHFLELQCLVTFQLSGNEREIGVRFNSCIDIIQKDYLVKAITSDKPIREVLTEEILPTTIVLYPTNQILETPIALTSHSRLTTSLSTPLHRFCSRKAFMEQSKVSKKQIVKVIKEAICQQIEIGISQEENIHNILLEIINEDANSKKRFRNIEDVPEPKEDVLFPGSKDILKKQRITFKESNKATVLHALQNLQSKNEIKAGIKDIQSNCPKFKHKTTLVRTKRAAWTQYILKQTLKRIICLQI
jgi:hypothetical protein